VADRRAAGHDQEVPSWAPNALTVLRILLVPAFLVHAIWCAEDVAAGGSDVPHRYLSFAAFVAIGVSDVADGWIARKWNLATPLGATLDAAADKFAQVSALVFFVLSDGVAYATVPLWLVVLIIGRDVLLGIGYLTVRARRGRVEVEHESHGRLATVLLFALVIWITLDLPRGAVLPLSLAIAVVVTASTVRYMRVGWRQLGPVARS
jgi:phosphatidylglycerophosphate synthase